jgi:hypothetical protein
MVRESVGDALRLLHRAIRPGGHLLDIHPEPENARIVVVSGTEKHELGQMNDSAYIADILAGRATIRALIEEGLFVPLAERTFTHRLHASDVDSWLEYRATRSTRSVLDPEIPRRARAILAEQPGEIQVVEHGHAGLFRRP